MTSTEKNIKRFFDFLFACVGLLFMGWFIVLMIILSKIIIGGNGIFKQKRVGQDGKLFTIYKIETINPKESEKEFTRIIKILQWMRHCKIDELPQFWNVLIGNMSFVGPRPDISGYADQLEGEERIILTVKPGITGPATLYFRNEEKLLKIQKNPETYNSEIIWPQKVAINIKYVKEYSFVNDIYYILKTVFF